MSSYTAQSHASNGVIGVSVGAGTIAALTEV
jgi:hypothetical protein